MVNYRNPRTGPSEIALPARFAYRTHFEVTAELETRCRALRKNWSTAMRYPSSGDVFKTIAHQVDNHYGRLRAAVKRRFGWIGPVKILPYRGYGNQHSWFLTGRVLEDRRVGSPQADDSWWDNMKAMYARFATDEIAGVRVRASIEGQSAESITDEEGYFRFHLRPAGASSPERLWQSVALQLLDEVCPGQGAVTALGSVLVPARDSDFGVISDVDDTVIESYATDFLKMARITFTNNARTRTPLPGVSRFYQALAGGPRGDAKNPFFYVSSSAWNLYDLLIDFLDLHEIPAGPVLLRDLGIDDKKFIKSGHDHKLEKIGPILNTCRDLPFVLIGDAGQEDPTIYREVVRRHAHRIMAIYIRAVAQRLRNERAMQMAKETTGSGVPMLLVEDVEQAMRHAADLGLISAAAVEGPSTAE